MGWRDQLRNASFRGVPFKVISTESGVGRRTVLHQYPFQDEPYVEDLGLDADEYHIEGYILASPENNYNYFSDRDNLVDALKEPGPGTLVHPFYGEITVALNGKAVITESFVEGGIARFRMSFVLAKEIKYPYAGMDYVTIIDDVAQYALDLSKDAFGTNYANVSSIAGWVLDGIGENVGSLHTMMKATMGTVKGAGRSSIMYASDTLDEINFSQSRIGEPSDFISILNDSFNGHLSLVGLYGRSGLKGILGTYSGRVRDYQFAPLAEGEVSYSTDYTHDLGISTVDALLEVCKYGETPGSESESIYGGTLEEVDITSSNRAKQQISQQLMIIFVRSLAILNACRVAVRIKYTSSQEAIEMMKRVVDVLDIHLDYIGAGPNFLCIAYGYMLVYDDFFSGMQALRATFVDVITALGADLSDVKYYEIGTDNMTALQLSYDLYDDLDRETDIIDRNSPELVKHPGFLPGGVQLEVLSA